MHRACFLAASLLLVCGCGFGDEAEPAGSDLPQYRLSGTVLLADEPLESGTLVLTPDTGNGNSGPEVRLPIENGKYDSGSGAGPHGGPYFLEVQSPSLQTPWEGAADLPKSDSEYDITIPAD